MGKFRSSATSDQAAAQPEGSRRSRGSRKLRNRIRRSWQGRDRGPSRESAAHACFGPAAGLALKLGTAQSSFVAMSSRKQMGLLSQPETQAEEPESRKKRLSFRS